MKKLTLAVLLLTFAAGCRSYEEVQAEKYRNWKASRPESQVTQQEFTSIFQAGATDGYSDGHSDGVMQGTLMESGSR